MFAFSDSSDTQKLMGGLLYPWPILGKNLLVARFGQPPHVGALGEAVMVLQFFLYAVLVAAGRAVKVRARTMLALVAAAHLAGTLYLLTAR